MFSCQKYLNIAKSQDDQLLIQANKNDYLGFYKFGHFKMMNGIKDKNDSSVC